MPQTTLELLDDHGREIEALVAELLTEHSAISVFRNDPNSSMVFVGVRNSWKDLDQPGRQLQSRILRMLDRYEPLVRALMRGAPTGAVKEVAEASELIREAVDQSDGTFSETPEDVEAKVHEAFQTHREHLGGLYDPTPGQDVYVPDANAIILNPDLEDWEFEDSPRFSVVVTSTLLGELDELKMRDKNESVREKAAGAIRRINEYGRRGDIHAGVPLRRDRSTVRMTAVEPDFEHTLPWLDRSVKDDRLVASVIEIMREHPQSSVMLVTLDGNLVNKARYAEIPFVAPPDPPKATPKKPRLPDVKILSFTAKGGSHHGIVFHAEVQNRDTKPLRLHPRATIAGDLVGNSGPDPLDLLVNKPPERVYVELRRPEQGDLVKALNDETTLYEKELLLSLVDDLGNVVASRTWSEIVYDEETEAERYSIQQAVWRLGRGEATDADLRDLRIAEHVARQNRS